MSQHLKCLLIKCEDNSDLNRNDGFPIIAELI